jgi:hypothetical protein
MKHQTATDRSTRLGHALTVAAVMAAMFDASAAQAASRPVLMDQRDGPPVNVAAGSTQTIDSGLAPLATIVGTLTDALTGTPLVMDTSGTFSVWACKTTSPSSCFGSTIETATDPTGHYTIDNLPPGSYYLKTISRGAYIDEVYSDIPCKAADCGVSSGTPVVAPAGVTTINFALSQGGVIAGTLRRSDTGLPISWPVVVYNAATSVVRSVQSSLASGQYSLSGLPTGLYYVATGLPGLVAHPVVDEVYPDVPCVAGECRIASGALVSVTAGATTSGIDFSLDASGTISGRVTDAQTGAPCHSLSLPGKP